MYLFLHLPHLEAMEKKTTRKNKKELAEYYIIHDKISCEQSDGFKTKMNNCLKNECFQHDAIISKSEFKTILDQGQTIVAFYDQNNKFLYHFIADKFNDTGLYRKINLHLAKVQKALNKVDLVHEITDE